MVIPCHGNPNIMRRFWWIDGWPSPIWLRNPTLDQCKPSNPIIALVPYFKNGHCNGKSPFTDHVPIKIGGFQTIRVIIHRIPQNWSGFLVILGLWFFMGIHPIMDPMMLAAALEVAKISSQTCAGNTERSNSPRPWAMSKWPPMGDLGLIVPNLLKMMN